MKVWNHTINNLLQCEIEENYKFDRSLVALIHDDGLKQKVFGNVLPIYQRFLVAF